MKKTTKRLLAAVLCLVMVLGALPLTALADTPTADVVYGKDEGSGWSYDGTVRGTVTVGDNITLKKTATKKADNRYEVTLEVQLKQTSTTTSAAAATTLVFDLSNSMKWCMVCGENHYASNHKTYPEVTSVQTSGTYYIKEDEDQYARVYYCDGDHPFSWNNHAPGWYRTELFNHEESNRLTPKTEENSEGTPFYTREQSTSTDKIERLKTAKEAAISFLQTYSGLTGFNENGTTTATQSQNLQRYFSLVTFGSSATKQSFSAGENLYWVDVSNPQNFNTVVGIISNLETSGATNLDAGLRRANELMQEDTVKNIKSAHKNVIAMTDGAATYYVSVNDGKETNEPLHSDNGCSHTNEVTAATAATLKSSIGSLYTVCVSASSVSCYKQEHCSYSHKDSPTVGNFLKDSIATAAADGKTYAYNANNQSELLGAFSSIAETVTTGLNAGTVTDNLPTAGVTTTSTDFVEGVMSWELDPANATDKSKDGDTTTYTYTKTYTVTIDPDEVTPDANGYVPLNGETTFTYGDDKVAYFPIPAGKVTPNTKYKLTYKNPLVTTDTDYVDDDITETSVTLAASYSDVSFSAPTEAGHTIVFIGWSETAPTKVLDKGDTVPTLVTSVTFSEDETEKTVYAVWGYDDIGGEEGGNGTPDVFDGTVTFKVVNGAWSRTTSDTERTVTKPLYEKNSNNEWVEKTGVVLETSDIPSVDSVVAFSGYKKPGTWDAEPKVGDAFVDDTTYTYTLPKLGSYTVTYVPNAGSDTVSNMPSSQTKTEGMPLTLVAGIPSRTNYAFQGWNTQANGGGTTYASGDSYETDANLTLYAQWQENEKYTYTLKYDANGGTGAPVDDVYPADDGNTYDESHTFDVSTAEPTRANYTFLGWADSADATEVKYTSGGSDGTAATVTLTKNAPTKTIYAVWQENDNYTFTLTYDKNAGTDTVTGMPTPNPANSGKVYTNSYNFTVSSTMPSRDGYAFKGWATTANAATADVGATVTVSTTNEDNNKTIYAVWERLLPELSVTKTVTSIGGTHVTSQSGLKAEVGDEIVWTITVTNSGNADGKFTLTDTLTGTNGTAIVTTTALEDTNNYYTVPAKSGDTNGTIVFIATYTVVEDDNNKTLKNTVKVSPESGDPTEGGSGDIKVDSDPNLSVAKTVYKVGNTVVVNQQSIPTAQAGDAVIWKIVVTNSGKVSGDFTLTDILGKTPITTFYSDPDCEQTTTNFAVGTGDNNTATYYVKYDVTADDVIGSTLVNKVTLKEAGKADKDSTAPGVPVGGLTVKKIVGTEIEFEPSIDESVPNQRAAAVTPAYTAKVGETITWTITVKNYYSSEQTFTLEDTLSNGKQVTLNPAPSSDGEYTIAAAKSVGEPTVKTITATYEVQASDEGKTLVNNVKVTPTDGTPIEDDAPGVEVEGKLSVDKTVYSIKRGDKYIYGEDSGANAIPTAKVGDDIIWKIKVTNTDSADADFKLEDILGTTGLPIYGSKLVGTELVPNGFDEVNKIIGEYMILGEEGVTNIVSFFVKYTVKPSDLGSTLVNTVVMKDANDGKIDDDTAPGIKVEDKPNTPSYNPNYNAGVQLEKGEHFNYVIGYSDGTVRPEGNITRAEVATIFFRLLTDESRKTYLTEYNTFTDVEKSMWHNVAISTLARAGVLNGYNDGSFRPDNNITRAEMAAIISRFAELEGSTRISFTDIKGHWAEKSILLAASNGWINGYNDGSFRPDQNITRAETFAMINRVLERKVEHVNDLVSDMNTWVDNMDTTQWYYFDVQEATNYHSYQRKYTNTNAEKWIKKLTDIDWTVYQY